MHGDLFYLRLIGDQPLLDGARYIVKAATVPTRLRSPPTSEYLSAPRGYSTTTTTSRASSSVRLDSCPPSVSMLLSNDGSPVDAGTNVFENGESFMTCHPRTNVFHFGESR